MIAYLIDAIRSVGDSEATVFDNAKVLFCLDVLSKSFESCRLLVEHETTRLARGHRDNSSGEPDNRLPNVWIGRIAIVVQVTLGVLEKDWSRQGVVARYVAQLDHNGIETSHQNDQQMIRRTM